MADKDPIQLAELVDEDDSSAVLTAIQDIWRWSYPSVGFQPIPVVTGRILSLFKGEFSGYHACDTDYHNLRHTLAVFLATARLIDGRTVEKLPFKFDIARDLLLAALFHDTGYIRLIGEEAGTGARYTSQHVERSTRFVQKNAKALELECPDRIARMVWATGLRDEITVQDWASAEEREAGAILASADLVGQMADRAYLEKLLFLYYEFREAGFPGYDTEFDILLKTVGFYEMTVARLDGELGGVRSYLRAHFRERHGHDRDLYAESMDRQMAYLRGILADDSTNFRKKLRRMDLEAVHPRIA